MNKVSKVVIVSNLVYCVTENTHTHIHSYLAKGVLL